MNISIQLGWWCLPALITAIAFCLYFAKRDTKASGYVGAAVVNAFIAAPLAIIVLICWLIWAIFK